MSEPDVEQASDASREDYYAWNVDDSPTSLSDCRAARAALQQIEAEEPKWLPLPLGHHFDKDDHWPDHCAAYIGGSPSEDSSYCGRPASEHERQ